MELSYERGDAGAPKGHALLYFRGSPEGAKLYGTYIICLPIPVDLVKDMPPFLAPHIGEMGGQEMSAFAFPPVPEEVESRGRLEALAQARDDDLLFGGTMDSAQVPRLLERVNEAVEWYARAYAASIQARVARADQADEEQPSGLGVTEVLYELMAPRDRLTELSRLVGKLRFAAEGGDARQVEEAEREVRLLARRLPEGCRVDDLIKAAKVPTSSGGELAALYLERCYKLLDEDYPRLQEIEGRIRALELREARGQP
jgi:hypothetical protein